MSVTQREVLIRLVHDLARQINDASAMLETEHGLAVTYERPESGSAHEYLKPAFTKLPIPPITHGLQPEVPVSGTGPGAA